MLVCTYVALNGVIPSPVAGETAIVAGTCTRDVAPDAGAVAGSQDAGVEQPSAVTVLGPGAAPAGGVAPTSRATQVAASSLASPSTMPLAPCHRNWASARPAQSPAGMLYVASKVAPGRPVVGLTAMLVTSTV